MACDFDIITIGLGPAGMAVAAMGQAMGLEVCAFEKHAVGGECMNVGCIPSKALLRMAKARRIFDKLPALALKGGAKPEPSDVFAHIQRHLDFISEKKTMTIFEKIHMVYRKGPASFVDAHTVEAGGERHTARKIFICAGTRPEMPAFEGLADVDVLTNENVFAQETVPDSLIVVGGGAIACEMAQAFRRLGSEVTLVIRGPRLMWRESPQATDVLEQALIDEGVEILREQKPARFENVAGRAVMHTDAGRRVEAAKVLVAAGRRMDLSELRLDNAGVAHTDRGITVDKYLRTSRRHIFACGDCNGYAQFSHAAMHQGMIGLMNAMLPGPMKRDFRRFVVPWTVFTEPQFSRVGASRRELDGRGVRYETIRVNYGDYGAAIAEAVDAGHVEAYVSPAGRIHGVTIVGEGSGEMINEWALAIQTRRRMHDLLLLQHSFPTMGFLTKRTAETWMMARMKSPRLRKLCRFLFRR
ncbi:MAG: NAD(P)/FAD-dependent oxidoreductase [Planctomycetes bacterium]|nr:NAD(P)/FAD-dependent oxidoreductase [Planctomycetota bacterium]